LILTGLDNGIR